MAPVTFPATSSHASPLKFSVTSVAPAPPVHFAARSVVRSVAAKSALQDAGIDGPDAIVVGTRWGGMQPTMELLKSMVENGEKDFSPTSFMQSTHNTPASTLARLLGCHGYNVTLSIHNLSFDFARAFAFVQLNASDLRNVLVCSYDEEVPEWQQLLEKVEDSSPAMAKAFVIKKE